jgi:hypothetical protein
MSHRLLVPLCGLAQILTDPAVALAGMPSFTVADVGRALSLSNLTRMRLEAISFFLVGLLFCAAIVQGRWNSLRKDFGRLPRLSYGKAFGIVILWGLLFVLVLTMISDARELMTPGAREKQGLTYRLAQEDASEAVSRQITARHNVPRLPGLVYGRPPHVPSLVVPRIPTTAGYCGAGSTSMVVLVDRLDRGGNGDHVLRRHCRHRDCPPDGVAPEIPPKPDRAQGLRIFLR